VSKYPGHRDTGGNPTGAGLMQRVGRKGGKMSKILLVNELVDEMRKNWQRGWVKWDASNSYEPAAEYHDRAEFDAAWETAQGRGARCSFYTCPLCEVESCNCLDHILNHDEAIRLWVQGGFLYIAEPGCRGAGGLWEPITVQWKDTMGLRRIDLTSYVESASAKLIRDFLAKQVGFADLKAAMK